MDASWGTWALGLIGLMVFFYITWAVAFAAFGVVIIVIGMKMLKKSSYIYGIIAVIIGVAILWADVQYMCLNVLAPLITSIK